MPKTVLRVWNLVTTVLVWAMVFLAALLVAPRLFGFQVFAVLSGSMEPAYQTGSVIYVRPVDADTLAAGDVITYMISENTVATHRIVGVVPDEDEDILRFRTKGDANDTEDALMVHEANIIGTPVFTIPLLGRLAALLNSAGGRYQMISLAALIAMLVVIPELFAGEEPEASGEKEKEGTLF